jgi:bacterioferritin
MRGDPGIIDALNEILTAELTAINQYFVHWRMCENWGYQRLARRKREESLEEMKDADRLIERILYLEGVPNLQRLNPVRVGENALEQHRLDLELEREAVRRYNAAIALCRERGDNGTRALLESQLAGEERSVEWLEAQLYLAQEVGRENYLAQQLHADGG